MGDHLTLPLDFTDEETEELGGQAFAQVTQRTGSNPEHGPSSASTGHTIGLAFRTNEPQRFHSFFIHPVNAC